MTLCTVIEALPLLIAYGLTGGVPLAVVIVPAYASAA
jgi:hypothetical protein